MSVIDLSGELAGAYQNRSGEPIISLPIRRSGAPFEYAPIAPDTPTPVAMSMLPPITACWDSAPPEVNRISSSRPYLLKMPARWPSSATRIPQATLRNRDADPFLGEGGRADSKDER